MIASAEYAADSGDVITSSPGPMSERAQRQRERVGAGADADRVGAPHAAANSCLERLELRAEHEPAALDDARDRGVDVGGVVAGPQLQERDHAASR